MNLRAEADRVAGLSESGGSITAKPGLPRSPWERLTTGFGESGDFESTSHSDRQCSRIQQGVSES